MKRNLIFSFIIISILKAQTSIISGFVSDSSSGEALIGANVFLRETGQGMATDVNGYYIIQDIVSGNYTLMVSYIGFDMYKQKTRLSDGESKKVNINLVEQVVQLTEIEVTAEKLQRRNNIQPSKINLRHQAMLVSF
jgi:hypothetical protein